MRAIFHGKINIILWIALCMLAFASCKKHKDVTQQNLPVQDGGVYITNEGNYGWSNGRVDYYRFADGSLTEDIFQQVNHRPLGDVVQSMTISGGRGYIVVNNSGKVEVVNMTGFTSIGTITGLTSPRYLVVAGSSKAYVSDLYSNAISIVDLSSFQKTGQIALHGSTEEMLIAGQTLYVTNTRTAYIYLINIATNTLTDSIALSYATNSIRMDKEGKLWVQCAGDQALSINAALYRIDTATKAVIRSFALGNSINVWDKLAMSAGRDTLYYLNAGLWRLTISATTLPSAALIAQGSLNLYGLGVDPATGNIYMSDAVDYVQKGKVYRYHPDGSLIDCFTSGVIPGGFNFK